MANITMQDVEAGVTEGAGGERPRVAILGAGPVGLDAALAVHDAGFPFTVYEAAPAVAGSVRSWGHVRLFSPWSMNVSPRMRRHLAAAGVEVPSGQDHPTGAELVERLLEPVARLDAVAPRLELDTRVAAVSRDGLLKDEAIGDPARTHVPFRLLVEGPRGERLDRADVVLDCTGSYGHANALGVGGIPAPGERALDDRIVRTIPDVLGEPGGWLDRRVLLVGAGYSAQTVAGELAELARRHVPDGPEVVWAVRSPDPDWGAVENDPLPARARLSARSLELAEGASDAVEVRTGVGVEELRRVEGGVAVRLRHGGGVAGPERGFDWVEVDRIVALTGYVGDHGLYRQLQIHECWATSGPMKLSAALLGSSSKDCLAQSGQGAETLVSPEPNFFLLGSKSYGRNSSFLLRVGWEQVSEVLELLPEAGPVTRGTATDGSSP